MNNLNLYRKEKQSWAELAYCEATDKDRGSFDHNEKRRYAIFIALQYDFREEDEELIRFLFEQEVIARENDSFQGIGKALWLGAFLLARFNNPSDIPLFYRAKHSNFDTGCGFDKEFIYTALREKTEEYVLKNYPELYVDIKGGYTDMNLSESLDEWWSNLSQQFPKDEKDESLLELYERNMYFENMNRAKEYLAKWKNREPDSEQKDGTLKYAYIELGEIPSAIEIVKKELTAKETNWDKASCNLDLLQLYTKIASKDGLQTIKAIDHEFNQFESWKQVGLGRIAVHAAFEYSIAARDMNLSKSAFKIAYSWFKKMDSVALVGLEAGLRAAKKCFSPWKARMFRKLAEIERDRINKALKGL